MTAPAAFDNSPSTPMARMRTATVVTVTGAEHHTTMRVILKPFSRRPKRFETDRDVLLPTG
jgi:hypothetical protein